MSEDFKPRRQTDQFGEVWRAKQDMDSTNEGTFNPLTRLMGTRGLVRGVPSNAAIHLLTGVKSYAIRPQSTARGLFGSNVSILTDLSLMASIPHVVGHRRTRYITILNGLELLKYWAVTDDKFAQFYDAYVDKADEDRIGGWDAMEKMGLEIPPVHEAREKAKAAEEIRAKRAKEGAAQLAQAAQVAKAAQVAQAAPPIL